MPAADRMRLELHRLPRASDTGSDDSRRSERTAEDACQFINRRVKPDTGQRVRASRLGIGDPTSEPGTMRRESAWDGRQHVDDHRSARRGAKHAAVVGIEALFLTKERIELLAHRLVGLRFSADLI